MVPVYPQTLSIDLIRLHFFFYKIIKFIIYLYIYYENCTITYAKKNASEANTSSAIQMKGYTLLSWYQRLAAKDRCSRKAEVTLTRYHAALKITQDEITTSSRQPFSREPGAKVGTVTLCKSGCFRMPSAGLLSKPRTRE